MRRRDHNIFTNGASLLICGLLAGVVVAAAAFPAVAVSGLAAKAGAETFDQLPSELTVKQSPQMSYLYAADGKKVLATMYDENRRDVTKLEDISPLMQKAIIAAEDHAFYNHNGVDLKGIARAFVANHNAGETSQGASTLTMQYVRLAISYSATSPAEVVAATEDTGARKLREARYAMAIDKELSKDEILLRYLNIAYFGNGAYGIWAASQVYFNKPPKDLKVEEAALLAGLVKSPSSYDPTTASGKKDAQDRRNWVLDQMVGIGAIDQAQANAAKQTKVAVRDKRTPNGCVSTSVNHWGFFCDFFYRWWLEQETFGATPYERERQLKSGGYRVVTTLDVETQASAKANIEKVYKTSKDHSNALMIAAVEPGTGRVRALAVNRNFRLDDPKHPQNPYSTDPVKRAKKIRGSVPNTTNPLITGGGDIRGYQAGSTFKIFTVVAALEKGIPLSTRINAKPVYRSKYVISPGSPAACTGTHFYCPKNANASMTGTHTMWGAFGRSVNTFFVPLEEMAGAQNVVNAAKKLGIKFREPQDAEFAANADGWGAFTLGVSSATPLDIANAYATLAADGKHCEPTPVQEIRDHTGAKLDVANPTCDQAVDVEVARAAVDVARCPVGDRSSTSRCTGATAGNVRRDVGKPVMGKSGTTDSARTASLVVSTKQLTVFGILANPDYANTKVEALHPIVNAATYNTLRDAMKGKKAIEFTPPSGKLINGDQRHIPSIRCLPIDRAKNRLEGAGFVAEVATGQVDSSCPAGTAAGTTPEGSTVKGGLVTIEVSNGKGAEPGSGGGGNGGRGTPTCPPSCGPPGRN
ncbi:penicillin-binding protein [Rhizomonospora bruguierae]|uniref:penicillin-binding protein n=1 Tax=Rhizomonospora bruguierae TaxID=1581705 RepID=UPI001BCAD5B8|nr:transglycosylase domain-containing protein [Micromonospora sp. NBRC 107566]